MVKAMIDVRKGGISPFAANRETGQWKTDQPAEHSRLRRERRGVPLSSLTSAPRPTVYPCGGEGGSQLPIGP